MDLLPRNPLNHRLAEGVRRIGFRKWYERELLSSHAHMVLALLCTIALMATIEVFHNAPLADKLLNVAFFIVSAVVGVWSLRRYLYLLMHAEEVANQATCDRCGTYARLEFVSEDRRDGRTGVRCKQCRHEWTMTP